MTLEIWTSFQPSSPLLRQLLIPEAALPHILVAPARRIPAARITILALAHGASPAHALARRDLLNAVFKLL